MKNFRTATLLGGAIAAMGLAIAAPAQAGTMAGGWNYTVDNYNDGSGGEKYNIRGFAIKETDEEIFIGLTGGIDLDGHDGNTIGWGDLVINFSPETDFNDMIEDYGSYTNSQKVYDVKDEYKDSLLAIRFAPNDQGGEYGVYSVDSFKGITMENSGYKTIQHYDNKGYLKDSYAMGDLSTKAEVKDYFGTNQRILNVVEDGTKIADITQLGTLDLAAEGLDFTQVAGGTVGDYTLGFKVSKSAFEGYLPGGISNYMAHIFLECANDGVALAGNFTMPDEGNDDAVVPEPSALLGLSAMGLAFFTRKRRQSA
ncbi:MAG: PEP-CTERM sorting domain-containing protein [Cyanobacteria bacterium SBLK]|nr:PEP-CTERM sorting domain-containing protein [Cyanobacteria bacterium SBLK]